jgi:hypothetical protein
MAPQMKPAIALSVAALLAACAAIPPASIREGPVALRQTAYVDGPSVTPLEVIEDSRCPADVQCIWAGRVVVRTKIHLGSGDMIRDLVQGEPIGIADGALELTAITLAPRAGVELGAKDYRFTYRFDGGL